MILFLTLACSNSLRLSSQVIPGLTFGTISRDRHSQPNEEYQVGKAAMNPKLQISTAKLSVKAALSCRVNCSPVQFCPDFPDRRVDAHLVRHFPVPHSGLELETIAEPAAVALLAE